MRTRWIAFLLAASCSTPASDPDGEAPGHTTELALAHPNRARAGESTYVQAFVIVTSEPYRTEGNLFEGPRHVPSGQSPVSFEIANAACDDGACTIEKIGPWSEQSGRKIYLVPQASAARLRVVTTSGLADEIALRYEDP